MSSFYLNYVEVADESGASFGNTLTIDREAARDILLSGVAAWFDYWTTQGREWGGDLSATPQLRVRMR